MMKYRFNRKTSKEEIELAQEILMSKIIRIIECLGFSWVLFIVIESFLHPKLKFWIIYLFSLIVVVFLYSLSKIRISSK